MAGGIDIVQVQRIARLCGLQLNDEEKVKMRDELSQILAHVDRLAELSLEDIPATDHVQLTRMPLRPDAKSPGLQRSTVLDQAPASDGEGFCVPAFVDEG